MSRSLDDLRSAVSSVVGITVTPFSEDGGIDELRYRELVTRTIKAGVSVLTPNGNTSEFYSLSPDERHRAVELTIEASGDAVILAAVGLDLESAVADSLRYRDLGVEGIMVHQPVLPFWSTSGWVEYHREIAAAVPDMGIVPYVRDPRVGVHTMRKLLDACPNLIGVKYAIPDPAAFAELVNALGSNQVSWICGVAETWAPFFAVAGATGFTSGLVSVDPKRSLRMLDQLRAKDYEAAMVEWRQIEEFEALRARNSSEFNVSVVKEALAQLGLCRRDVRAPLSLLPRADRDAVTRILNEWSLTSSAVAMS